MTGKTYTIAQFEVALKRLEKTARGEALKRSAMAGGFVIEGQAKVNVERTFQPSTGNLAGSIFTDVIQADDTRAEVAVGPSVVYGRIQELGGTVKPVFAKMLHWVDESGEHHFANEVTLPARPYLRPAVDENGNKIVKAISENLRIEIEAAL
ncbi:MAG: HK97 gp10 family phage protein [Bryobacterales bacterium]|nr:HK97 gp10 family phage protein [Bryobacterales bacterium]